MLGRAGLQVAGAERLRRSTRPMEDPGLAKLLGEAQELMQLTRKVRLAVTETLTSPAVVGVFVPTLILPLSLLTTLTPEQLRFVLLHELAHIRRGDYLANLFQLFAEALLFFNPAVWWISSQIRREREACCDALATELSGAPAEYARVLVRVAERSIEPAPGAATAFGNRREPSSLLERAQRLLVPGYRPLLRLTWRAMLLALFAGAVLLFLSAAATRMTVAAVLSPQQRMERIERKMTEYGVKPLIATESGSPEQKVAVTGRLRMEDGSPLPKRSRAIIHSQNEKSSGFYAADVRGDGILTNAVSAGRIFVEADIEGWAPAIAGPFDASATNFINAGEIILRRGFEISLQTRDAESGAAITNAMLQTTFVLRQSGHHLQRRNLLRTDRFGRATLGLCVDLPLQVTVNAAGYEVVQQQFESLRSGQTLELRLRPGRAVPGKVVATETGRGIGGATVRIIHEKSEVDQHYSWTDDMRIVARTDETGAFTITQLRRSARYWLGVSAPGHESVIIPPTAIASGELRVQLGPELIVRGRVVGGVEALVKHRNQPALYASFAEQAGHSSFGFGEWVPIRVVDGAAIFEFTNRVAGPVRLRGGTYSETRTVSEPLANWVVDLNDPPKSSATLRAESAPQRELIFRFRHPSGTIPRGTVMVSLPESLDPEDRSNRSEEMAITNGELRVSAAIGGEVFIEPRHLPGFWFDDQQLGKFGRIEVTNGAGPLVINVPLTPAGAIYATARNPDGTAAGGLHFGVHELERAPGRGEKGSLGNNSDSYSGDAPRRWVSGPLPLGGAYEVYAWRGNLFSVSKPIKLTGADPDAEVELQFGPGKHLEGIVLDPAGTPVPDATLEVNYTLRSSHGFGLKPVFTDESGRFRLENATPDLGEYSVQVNAPGLMAEHVKLAFGPQPQTIRARKGERLAGRVVEASSGHPIPDTEVRVADLETFKLPMLRARTDAGGRFEFTSLGEITYTLFIDAGNIVGSPKFRAGRDTNATVTVTLHPWSKLKVTP